MNQAQAIDPEKLYPFALRARLLLVGRQVLARSRSKLQFILVTKDLSPGSLESVLKQYSHYPIVQHYSSEDLEKYFQVNATKILGFKKSELACSIYKCLKQYRINRPTTN